MSGRRTNVKRDRSRSASSDRDSYERTLRSKNERPQRLLSGGLMGGNRSSKSKKVYVSNISFDATFIELKEEFSSVGEVTFVQMLKDENNRFKGCAVITFKEPDMAAEAIETLNRQEFKGRKLVVKEEDANPDLRGSDRKRARDDFESRSIMPLVASLPSTANYSTYGLSMTFLESLKIDLPLINIVFVANLDYIVDDMNLRDVFSLAGRVVDCEIFKDKEGKSRGFGIVEYEHPVEAVQAISMLHNQSYRDRPLTVRMDRSDRKKDGKPKLPQGLKSVGMGLGIDGAPLRDVKSANPLASVNPLGAVSQLNAVSLGAVSSPPSLTSQLNTGVGLIDPLTTRIGLSAGGLAGGLAGVGGRDYSHSQSHSSSYTSGSLGNIIQISNLPMDYTSDTLRKLCWTYGDVRVAEMRSQGTGMVKFRSDAEAQRAVNILDRQPLEGRMITARVL